MTEVNQYDLFIFLSGQVDYSQRNWSISLKKCTMTKREMKSESLQLLWQKDCYSICSCLSNFFPKHMGYFLGKWGTEFLSILFQYTRKRRTPSCPDEGRNIFPSWAKLKFDPLNLASLDCWARWLIGPRWHFSTFLNIVCRHIREGLFYFSV